MDAYFDEDADPPPPRPLEEIPAFPFPIEPIDISLARWQVASRIGKLPFDGYEACTRSLWLVFAGDWGVWVRAVIPVDNRLDAEDRAPLSPSPRRPRTCWANRNASASPSPPSCFACPPRSSPPRPTGRISAC